MLWSRHHSICKNFALSVRCWDFQCDVSGLETSTGLKSVWVWSNPTQQGYVPAARLNNLSWPHEFKKTSRSLCLLPHGPRVIASGILFHLVVPCCIDRLHVWLLSRWSAGKALSYVSAPIQLGQKWVSRDHQPPKHCCCIIRKAFVRFALMIDLKVSRRHSRALRRTPRHPVRLSCLPIVPQFSPLIAHTYCQCRA